MHASALRCHSYEHGYAFLSLRVVSRWVSHPPTMHPFCLLMLRAAMWACTNACAHACMHPLREYACKPGQACLSLLLAACVAPCTPPCAVFVLSCLVLLQGFVLHWSGVVCRQVWSRCGCVYFWGSRLGSRAPPYSGPCFSRCLVVVLLSGCCLLVWVLAFVLRPAFLSGSRLLVRSCLAV